MSDVPQIEVQGQIKLGQFLKLADLVENGALARELVQDGDVEVNGQVETRRGHTLADADIVVAHTPQGSFAAQLKYV